MVPATMAISSETAIFDGILHTAAAADSEMKQDSRRRQQQQPPQQQQHQRGPPQFLQRLYAEEQQRRHKRYSSSSNSSSSTTSSNGLVMDPYSSSSASSSSASATSGGSNSVNGGLPPGLSYSASSTASSEPSTDLLLDDFSSSESVASSSFSRSTSPSIKAAFWFQQNQSSLNGGSASNSLANTPNSAYFSYPSPTFSLSGTSNGNYAATNYPSWSSPNDRQMSPASSYHHQLHHQGNSAPASLLQQPFSLPPPSLALTQSPAITIRSESANTIPFSSLATSVSTTSSSLWTTSSDDNASVNDQTIGPSTTPQSPARRQRQHSPGHMMQEEQTLQLPDNFAMVYPGVYRSSFPSKKHYPYLKNLGLKTVLTLVQDEYSQQNLDFFKEQDIQFFQIGIPGNKEPFVTIPDEKIRQALAIVLDKRNHPLLIHCNKGKHRTGCLVGCLRKMQCWSSTAIFEEYRKFSFPKSRAMDQLFIELFQPDWKCVDACHLPDWCLGEDGRTQITESFNSRKKKTNFVKSATDCHTRTEVSTTADVVTATRSDTCIQTESTAMMMSTERQPDMLDERIHRLMDRQATLQEKEEDCSEDTPRASQDSIAARPTLSTSSSPASSVA